MKIKETLNAGHDEQKERVQNKDKKMEKEQEQKEKKSKEVLHFQLKSSFDRVFEKCLSTFPEFNENGRIVLQMQLARFYDVSIRNDYIKLFGKTVAEQDYLDSIYDKTLQEVYKKWVKHFEAKQIEEAQQKAKQQEKMNKSIALKILLGFAFAGFLIWALIKFALFAGIILAVIIFLVILGCAMK